MNRKEYEYLQSQLSGLDELLAMVPDDAVIDRMSLQSRRNRVAAKLVAYPVPARWPATACLTFNGKPVVAEYAIAADFSNRAVNKFADVLATVGASLRGALNSKGPIPNRENYGLLITDVAIGSFGFELEEDLVRSRHAPGESPLESALQQVSTILTSLSGSDDALAEAIADLHPRALNSLRDYLKLMADNHATCALTYNDEVFRFKDESEVRRSLSRLGPQTILEKEQVLTGSFQGYLPEQRRFEFRVDENRDVISGRVDLRTRNLTAINGILHQPARITVRVRKVGEGRPRYTVLGYSSVSFHAGQSVAS